MRKQLLSRVMALAIAFTLAAPAIATAQTRLKPGMNLFSIRDDIEIGRRSANEIDRKHRTHSDPRVERIGRRLAARSSMPNLPWRFRVIERRDVNAFALPGGYVYVTSGLLRSARSENELAGVLAHEITHVTLRHGTNQASKAALAQMPLQMLGGLMGRGTGSLLTQLGIGLGLNTLFLRYGRNAETQADVGAVQLMNRSGYDPRGLAVFLGSLKDRGGSEFFSDHPNSSNRVSRVNQEIRMLR
ncbi:MAG TPA: M48 family metallopeptidase [Blastocatellia bacterium]|nr:M48 family metallopeptidase [Blastocatellia bacterium]